MEVTAHEQRLGGNVFTRVHTTDTHSRQRETQIQNTSRKYQEPLSTQAGVKRGDDKMTFRFLPLPFSRSVVSFVPCLILGFRNATHSECAPIELRYFLRFQGFYSTNSSIKFQNISLPLNEDTATAARRRFLNSCKHPVNEAEPSYFEVKRVLQRRLLE